MTTTNSDFQDALTYAQTRLTRLAKKNQPITREAIEEAIDRAFEEDPDWRVSIDRDSLLSTLIQRNSIWIGEARVLEGNDDHVAWLNAERKQGWRYWPRYRHFLSAKMSEITIDSLDGVTSKILGLLEDPARPGPWDRRGLVVGHVQSGKTSNYTGLICKAADAGYKIIIVLAGVHKNLRSQTQMRLDEGFLGYETTPSRHGNRKPVGVGEIDPDLAIRPNYVTNRADDGDFKTRDARQLGITPEKTPWLFVVKKNKTVLAQLLKWIQDRVADTNVPDHESLEAEFPKGFPTVRKVVTQLPLLLIDDEADHASVDTEEQAFDENGSPDLEHDPKAINKLIRRILRSFSRSAFVGYTATPFANVFIHDQGRTELEGDDLFPRSFIMNLPGPSNYAGPVRIFGINEEEETKSPGLPLIRTVSDYAASLDEREREGWMPLGHKNGHRPLVSGRDVIPESLKEAIRSFLIVCAVRNLRKQERQHSSMLVHVTRFTNVQNEVVRQIQEYIGELHDRLRRNIGVNAIFDQFEKLWRDDFEPTTAAVNACQDDAERLALPHWSDVKALLPNVLDDVQVRAINGTAKDVLDYAENEGTGLKVIAVGGDKLARGLTLEGLSVSYFLRASRMYDTLMQMGRWFGYRPHYLDLCRLYTTAELEGWFQHITRASEELRETFEHMVATGGTPKLYGLKIRSHPVLLVTSRVKMRTARELELSYSGDSVETTVLFRHPETLRDNYKATVRFVETLGTPDTEFEQGRPGGKKAGWSGSLVWENVSHENVENFLDAYKTHDHAYKANSQFVLKFIKQMAANKELTSWTVAVLGGRTKYPVTFGDYSLQAIERSPDERADQGEGRYIIRRLLSPRDEAIDLDANAYAAALAQTRSAAALDPARGDKRRKPENIEEPNGPAIRHIRGLGSDAFGIPAHPERGLLLIYPIDPSKLPDVDVPVIAIGISFPGSKLGTKVKYKVNNVYWGQEIGGGSLE